VKISDKLQAPAAPSF